MDRVDCEVKPRSMAELSQRAIRTGHAGPAISQPLKILDPSSEAENLAGTCENALGCDDRHKANRPFCDDRHIGARKDALYLDQEIGERPLNPQETEPCLGVRVQSSPLTAPPSW